MFGSNILDIAIGLFSVFLILSLIASAAGEIVESFFKSRAGDLEKGIQEMVGEGADSGFLREIYNHGLINSLYQGQYGEKETDLPSYIPARNFALAFLAVVRKWEASQSVLPSNVMSALEAFGAAETEVKELQEKVEGWYNTAMDRVSGWYKRRTQYRLLVIGLIVSIIVNADCVVIAKRLANDASLRQGLVAYAEATAKQPTGEGSKQLQKDINTLASLGIPIGWSATVDLRDPGAWVERVIGWFLTAIAVSLGAPFWFDLLNKIIVVRSTVKPNEKSGEEASKDGKA